MKEDLTTTADELGTELEIDEADESRVTVPGRPGVDLLMVVGFGFVVAAGIAVLAWSGFDLERLIATTRTTDPLVFLALMALLPLIGFPISAFYLYAGAAFPLVTAWVLCVTALALNMTGAYFAGAYFLKGPIERWMRRRGYRVPQLKDKGHFRLAVLIRAVPGVPYPLQNYILSLSGCPFVLYLLISLFVQSTIAAGVIAVSTMLIDPEWKELVIVGAIVLVLVASRLLLVNGLRNKKPSGQGPPSVS